MIKKNKINWPNTLFITLTAVGGVIGTQILIVFGFFRWPTWILAAGMLIVCGLSVTAGYHRLAAHKSYRAAWPVRFFFAFFGAAAFEGSVLEWVTDHRNHHRYTDTDQDPYSIKKGFWYAHIGWLFTLDPFKRDFSNVQDLLADPIYRFQHRFFPIIAVIMGFGLPMAVGALWGDPLGGLIIAGALRIAFLHQLTFFINSLCHTFGKQTYKGSSAKDNWVTALLTFGEGFHNFHHQFPIDYRNGVRFFHFDPTKWLIYSLSRIGFASDLKRVEQCRMIKYRLHIDTRRLAFISEEITKIVVKPIYERIHHLLVQLEELEKSYTALRLKNYKNYLTETQQKLRATRRELRAFLLEVIQ